MEKEFISIGISGTKVLLEAIKELQAAAKDTNEIQYDLKDVVEPESITQGPRRSRHEPKRYRFLITDDKEIVLVDHNEPTTYQEAIIDPNSIR